MNELTTNDQFNLSPTSLQITGPVTFEQWQEAGQQLKYIESAIQWWIGDWLNYGEARWGEMYAQALDESDFKKGTLQNIKYVTCKVNPSLRNENLSYSHHVEVASLEPDEQRHFLEMADRENLTVRELRKQIKGHNGNERDYKLMVCQVIDFIDLLAENYPAGLVEVRIYLEDRWG